MVLFFRGNSICTRSIYRSRQDNDLKEGYVVRDIFAYGRNCCSQAETYPWSIENHRFFDFDANYLHASSMHSTRSTAKPCIRQCTYEIWRAFRWSRNAWCELLSSLNYVRPDFNDIELRDAFYNSILWFYGVAAYNHDTAEMYARDF